MLWCKTQLFYPSTVPKPFCKISWLSYYSRNIIWILVADWSRVKSSEPNAGDVTRKIGPLYFTSLMPYPGWEYKINILYSILLIYWLPLYCQRIGHFFHFMIFRVQHMISFICALATKPFLVNFFNTGIFCRSFLTEIFVSLIKLSNQFLGIRICFRANLWITIKKSVTSNALYPRFLSSRCTK